MYVVREDGLAACTLCAALVVPEWSERHTAEHVRLDRLTSRFSHHVESDHA